jgi:tRNA threonylcarbamoyladenosine biosynthesis protein TsaB
MLSFMNTLAFDTCFGACSVAATWRTPEGVAGAFRSELLERGHAERLLPMISNVMNEAPFDFADIARIVVTTGPGTFTGQRVGIAAARSLSLATRAQIATLSSLEVMAYTAAADIGSSLAGKTLAVAVDARRGELYFQAFAGSDLAPLGEPVLITAEAAVNLLGDRDVIAVGSGAEAVANAARGAKRSITARLGALQPNVRYIPDGAVIATTALPRPLYLRPPDAKPQDGASLARMS